MPANTTNPALPKRPSRAGYLPTLDGWRAIAIGVVLLAHARTSIFEVTNGYSNHFFLTFPALGLFGVRIFFGISGFLICSRLIDEHAVRGRISLKGFYIRRCFRIFPALLAMMLVVLSLSSIGLIYLPPRQWLAGVLFCANYVRYADDTWYVGHLWSLAVEEHFYLLLPGLLAFAGVTRGLRSSLIAAVLIALWRALLFKTGRARPDFDSAFFFGRSDIVADGLLWGCVVAFLYAPAYREHLRAALRPAVWWPLCLGLLLSLSFPIHLNWKLKMFVFTLQAMTIPLVLVGTVLWNTGMVGQLLKSFPMRWVGRLSYSLYLWQQLFLVNQPETGWLREVQRLPLNFVATFMLAILSYYVLELPTRRLGHWFARPVTPGCQELVEAGESVPSSSQKPVSSGQK